MALPLTFFYAYDEVCAVVGICLTTVEVLQSGLRLGYRDIVALENNKVPVRSRRVTPLSHRCRVALKNGKVPERSRRVVPERS